MANIFNKLWSGADFWNKKENQQQRQQFAQSDEEERKRKAALAARQTVSGTPAPGTIIGPATQKPAPTVGSQSDFTLNAGPKVDFTQPLIPIKPKTPAQQGTDAIEQRTQALLPEKQKQQGDSWLDRNVLHRGAANARAEVAARDQATREYQDVHGYNKQPEVQAAMAENKQKLGKLSEQSAQFAHNIDTVSHVAAKAGQVAQYVPVTGSVLNLGLAGADAATGHQDKNIQATRTHLDYGMTEEQYNSLDDATKAKLQNIRNIGLAASPLDFLGVGGIAKSEGAAAAKKAVVATVKNEAIDEATKAALKKAVTGTLKKAAVPTVIGTGLSVGAQEYLKGEVDPLEALKSGVLVGGTSLLTPSTQTAKLRKATAESLSQTGENFRAGAEGIQEGGNVPGRAADGAKTGEAATTELAPGVKVPEKAPGQAPDISTGPAPTGDVNVATAQGKNLDTPNTANVPDPANPIALAPATNVPDAPRTISADPAPMADFSNAMDVPLRRAGDTTPELTQVAGDQVPQNVTDPAALRVSTEAAAQDAQGNPALRSDVQAAQDGNVNPAPAPSLAATEEQQLAQRADQAAAAEVQGQKLAAPRTFERMAQQAEDPAAQAELLDAYPTYTPVKIAEEQATARNIIGQQTPEQLVESFRNGVDTSTPAGFYQAYFLAGRLGRTDVINSVPGAKEVAQMASNAVAQSKSAAGQSLGLTRILFQNMPPVMKRDMLIDQLGTAGKDMQDADRDLFLRLLERSDNADSSVGHLEDEARGLMQELKDNPGAADNEALTSRIDDLTDAHKQAETNAATATSDAVKFYDSFKPKGSVGTQLADTGRGLMLSGIGGRVFDNLATAQTAANDIATSNVSALVGKGVNAVTGDGNVVDSMMSPRALWEGTKQGAREIADSFRGKGRADATLESFNSGSGPTRSGVGDTNAFNRFVNNVVDIPTKLSKGIETARTEQLAKQEAQQLGLQGEEANMFARLRTIAVDDQHKHDAVQLHMRSNNLHENWVTDKLNQFVRTLSASKLGKENPRLAGAVDVLVKNQVAPFTSFLGGNLHRALTDKNIAYNIVRGIADLSKGNAQGFTDQVANLAVNSTQAYVMGMLLTKAGILTDKDANGNDYGGVYLHIGNRFIPAAILGAASVPVIFGNALQSSLDDTDNPGDAITKTFGRAVSNTFASAGVAGVFGGENNLTQTIDTVARGNGDNVMDPLTKYGSGLIRQYVNPAIFGDVNAAANNPMPFGLNPNATGEAPQIDATKQNAEGTDVKDVQATEKNRILAGIPGISQSMDRNPDRQATDLLDRGLKSTRETGTMQETRQKTENLADVKKQLTKDKISTKEDDLKAYLADGDYGKAKRALEYKVKEEQAKPNSSDSKVKKLQDQLAQADLGSRDIPTTDDGIKARTESGNYDAAMEGLQYQLDKSKGDKNTPESARKKTQDQITRLKVAKDKKYDPDTISLYDKTSASEWRAMGNAESADYDPDTYSLLAQYDADLAANGVSASTKDGSKPKFIAGKGGSGGGGTSKKGIITDIATNDFNGKFTPLKAQVADFNAPASAIPVLKPVPLNDQSKKKKITVSRGSIG